MSGLEFLEFMEFLEFLEWGATLGLGVVRGHPREPPIDEILDFLEFLDLWLGLIRQNVTKRVPRARV